MRSDMHKVIVERPRYGYSWAEPVRTGGSIPVSAALDDGEDYDSGPRRAPRFEKDKSFNEYLAPLEGYLLKQVGRPWDKVYGEICKGIDRRSVIGAHVLQHVPDYVEVPGDNRRWRRGTGLYVHPRTGILLRRKPERRRKTRASREPELVMATGSRAYKRYGELWFEVTYHEEDDERGWRRIVIDSKRQCNKKEIARISACSTSKSSSAAGSK